MRGIAAPILGFGLVFMALGSAAGHAEKSDRIALANGTEIIGEVKSLEYGELTVSTDYMRLVQVDFEQVLRVESKLIFEVEILDGTRYFGRLAPSDEEYVLVVESDQGTVRLAFDDVLVFNQTKLTRLGKNWGSVSLGLSFTQATDSLQVKTLLLVYPSFTVSGRVPARIRPKSY